MQRTDSAAENPATAIQFQLGGEMPPPDLLRQLSSPHRVDRSPRRYRARHLHGDDRRSELPRPESSCPASAPGQQEEPALASVQVNDPLLDAGLVLDLLAAGVRGHAFDGFFRDDPRQR